MSGKGFYIALALCLVAIGSAAYIAANGTFTNLNGNVKGGSSSSAASAESWEGTEQTGQTVSGVPDSRAASSEAASSSSVSSSSASSAVSSKTSVSTAAPTYYTLPVTGTVITAYSPNTPIYDKTMDDWRVSDYVNIAAALGTPVKACASGTVLSVKTDSLLGQEIIIQHSGGLQSIYANLGTTVSVKAGQTVTAGTVIGQVGQTAQGEISLAPHLHFAMMKNGEPVDPLVTVGSSK